MAVIHQSPWTAVALDLVEAAFGRIGMVAKTTIVPAAQFTSLLFAPGFDGSAAPWKDPDR